MRPTALRLVRTAGARGGAPKPPFGLAAFQDDATSIALELAPSEARGEGAVAEIAAQIPAADEIAAGAFVVLLGAGPTRGILGRLFRGGPAEIPRALRATALLARGYERIAATTDEASGLDLVWGTSPTRDDAT